MLLILSLYVHTRLNSVITSNYNGLYMILVPVSFFCLDRSFQIQKSNHCLLSQIRRQGLKAIIFEFAQIEPKQKKQLIGTKGLFG